MAHGPCGRQSRTWHDAGTRVVGRARPVHLRPDRTLQRPHTAFAVLPHRNTNGQHFAGVATAPPAPRGNPLTLLRGTLQAALRQTPTALAVRRRREPPPVFALSEPRTRIPSARRPKTSDSSSRTKHYEMHRAGSCKGRMFWRWPSRTCIPPWSIPALLPCIARQT